jgi:hypothetical protein
MQSIRDESGLPYDDYSSFVTEPILLQTNVGESQLGIVRPPTGSTCPPALTLDTMTCPPVGKKYTSVSRLVCHMA